LSTDTPPSAREFRAFWNAERKKRFSELLGPCVRELKLQDLDFDKHANGKCYGYAVVYFAEGVKIKCSPSTYHRIRRNNTPVSDDARTVLLYGIGKTALEQRETQGHTSTNLDQLASLYTEMIASRIAPPRSSKSAESRKESRGSAPVADALDMVAQQFQIRGNISRQLIDRFGFGDRPMLYFHTYRFAADPGYIQKSFTVVKRPSPELPVVTFRNFVDHPGGQRRSSGIVLPLAQQTVFLGQSDNGSYSKLMVIRNTVVPQDVYRGLLISDEPDEDAVAARFIMKATDVSDSRETNTGKLLLKDSGLDSKDIDSIRNRVPFILEDEVHNEHGKLLSQDEIVQRVGYLMQDSEGFPKLTIREDELFNPAADKFYTFNAALKRR
jgi:hypothetical protein